MIESRPEVIHDRGLREAAERIVWMHGPHRLPTLLKRVDMLARGRSV